VSAAGLAALDAGAQAVEEEFPGWHVWLSDAGHWYAVRTGATARWDRGEAPMTVDADGEAGMRAVLAASREAA
jgi:hypothetical protein